MVNGFGESKSNNNDHHDGYVLQKNNNNYKRKNNSKKEVHFSAAVKKRKKKQKEVSLEEFMLLNFSHPYGVLLSSNRLFMHKEDTNERKNQDVLTNVITNELWLTIFEYDNGDDLSHLVQSCCYFYAIGMFF